MSEPSLRTLLLSTPLILAFGASPTTSDPAPGKIEGPPAPTESAGAQLDPLPAAEVAARLGRPPRFLIGMGNDLAADHSQDGAYTLGVTLDLHYAYLVGLPGQGGWPDWNPGGSFVNILTDSADANGVVPMFTLYQTAAWGEGNIAALTNPGFMGPYWSGARLLFQRLAIFGKPAVVHLEPDFWGFAQRHNGNPAAIPVQVTAHAPECSDLPNNLKGMGRCLLRMARTISPQVLVGFHASAWAGSPAAISSYLDQLGAGTADIVVVEALDRDAGCFEAAIDPNCQRRDGPWYWDETNTTSPNFHEHLAWARSIHEGVGLPLLWWQLPFGVPSAQPGGTPGHYRDNRVRYLFAHTDEFVAAGGFGAVFGVGAGNQTYIDSDGGQFRNAVHAYFANPTPLPAPGTPRVSVTAPNGGESWPIGSLQQIRWTSEYLTSAFSLRVTLLNGATSSTLATLPHTQTSYNWTVGGPVTANARVRVECVGCPSSTSDESDGAFSITAAAPPPPVRADLNHDGKGDILWRNTRTGALSVWYMNGGTRTGGGPLSPGAASVAWRLATSADMNADGKTDILWQNTTSGALAVWYMDGATRTGGGPLSPGQVAPAWMLAASADMNADGRADILWQNTQSGALAAWYMNGATRIGGGPLSPGTVGLSWRLAATADMNDDGKTDLLWRNTQTGAVSVWYMNGTARVGGGRLSPGVVAPSWRLVAVTDMNYDGKADILWQNTSSGALSVWYMNGATRASGGTLSPGAVAPSWGIAGPR